MTFLRQIANKRKIEKIRNETIRQQLNITPITDNRRGTTRIVYSEWDDRIAKNLTKRNTKAEESHRHGKSKLKTAKKGNQMERKRQDGRQEEVERNL